MKKPMLWMLLVLFALCSVSCKREEEKDFGRPGLKDTVYIMDSQTNTIEGYVILEKKWGSIGSPERLYEKKEFSYRGDDRIPLYDFTEKLAKRYNFPISWDPEPHPTMRSVQGMTVRGEHNFFNIFRLIVCRANEAAYQKAPDEPRDPNVIFVGIIKKDSAVIKRVRRATHFKKM